MSSIDFMICALFFSAVLLDSGFLSLKKYKRRYLLASILFFICFIAAVFLGLSEHFAFIFLLAGFLSAIDSISKLLKNNE